MGLAIKISPLNIKTGIIDTIIGAYIYILEKLIKYDTEKKTEAKIVIQIQQGNNIDHVVISIQLISTGWVSSLEDCT